MNVRFGITSVVLCLGAPICSAAVSCSELDPSSPQFSNKLGSVGQAAGIEAGRFSQFHRQAILSICAGQDDRLEDLVDQGKVSAREVGALKRILVVGDSAPTASSGAMGASGMKQQANAGSTKPAARKPSADESTGIDGAVDLLFVRWAQTWFTDRYVRGSAHIAELMSNGTDYLVKGTFSFTRYGAAATIPFASTLKRANGFGVTNLCYNDTTSGMTDCTTSGQSSASSRLMGAVIIGGIVAGLNGSASSGSSSESSSSSSSPRCGLAGENIVSSGAMNCYGYRQDSSGTLHERSSDTQE